MDYLENIFNSIAILFILLCSYIEITRNTTNTINIIFDNYIFCFIILVIILTKTRKAPYLSIIMVFMLLNSQQIIYKNKIIKFIEFKNEDIYIKNNISK